MIVIHMVTAIYRSKKLDCYTVNVHISGVLKKINKRYPYFELEVEQTKYINRCKSNNEMNKLTDLEQYSWRAFIRQGVFIR